MTKKAKLRRLSVLQFIMVLVMFPVGFCWIFWVSARTREETLHWHPDMEIPTEWQAMLTNSGKAIEWPLGTVSQNPLGFALCTLALASFLAMLLWTTWIAARLKGFKKPWLE